jgi:hypothetical protein
MKNNKKYPRSKRYFKHTYEASDVQPVKETKKKNTANTAHQSNTIICGG